MKAGVLLAIAGEDEGQLVALLDAADSSVQVARRCADVAELLASSLAGLGQVAVLDADQGGVDRDLLRRLAQAGVEALLLAREEDVERCRSLRPAAVAELTAGPAEWATIVEDLAGHDDTGAAQLADNGLAGPPAVVASPGEDHAVEAAEVAAGQRVGKVVVVWGPAGAPGRTTLCANLAVALAERGEETLAVDCDTEAPSMAQTLGLLEETMGIAAAARMAVDGRLTTETLQGLCQPITSRSQVLAGLWRPTSWRELSPAALDEVLTIARARYAWTVVDVAASMAEPPGGPEPTFAPLRGQATSAALAAADELVIVGAAEPIGMHRLVLLLTELGDLLGEHASLPRHIVVNRLRGQATGDRPEQAVAEALARFAGTAPAVLIPDDRPALDRAVLAGAVLGQTAPASPAWAAINQLADVLSGSPRRSRRRARRRRARRQA